ncbi:MAG: hypothetical protein AB8B97_09580 [Granulosicoccus sp.]
MSTWTYSKPVTFAITPFTINLRNSMQHDALVAQLRTLKLAGMADAFEQ